MYFKFSVLLLRRSCGYFARGSRRVVFESQRSSASADIHRNVVRSQEQCSVVATGDAGCHLEVARASEGGHKELRQTEGFNNVEEALKNRQTVRWQKELAQIELKSYLVVLLEFR